VTLCHPFPYGGLGLKNIISILMISFAASLWGMIALFVKGLAEIGFTPMEIVAIRVIVALLLLVIIGLVFFRGQFKVKSNDLSIFAGSGIASIAFFNWCYFTAINQMNLSLAVILLYTAPALVVLLSRIFFKEELTFNKILAVIGTLAGCFLITGIGANTVEALSFIGFLIGLGSGVGYALYSIFGKIATQKYQPFTITFYTFLFASLFLFPITQLWHKLDLLFRADTIFWAIGLGLIPTVLAYFLYTKGLERMESSKAAIISTVEPIVATLLSIFLYKEGMSLTQIVGTSMIFAAVIIVNFPSFRIFKTKKGLTT
jgi:drug/metabolite transporter, DME family